MAALAASATDGFLVEPEIVVGGEIDELAAFDDRGGAEPAVMGSDRTGS